MTVELIEYDKARPAGPANEAIISQTFVDLDQEKSPFKFKMDYVLPQTRPGYDRALRVYITDWAGRLIYELGSYEPYRGPEDDYKMTVEPRYQP